MESHNHSYEGEETELHTFDCFSPHSFVLGVRRGIGLTLGSGYALPPEATQHSAPLGRFCKGCFATFSIAP